MSVRIFGQTPHTVPHLLVECSRKLKSSCVLKWHWNTLEPFTGTQGPQNISFGQLYASLDLTNQLMFAANTTCADFDGTPRAQRPPSVQAATSASNMKKE